jgi:hypothetical protein
MKLVVPEESSKDTDIIARATQSLTFNNCKSIYKNLGKTNSEINIICRS